MKALEFESRREEGNQIQLPPDVAEQIPQGTAMRVILLLDSDEDEAWRRFASERFAAAYSEEDAIYESSPTG